MPHETTASAQAPPRLLASDVQLVPLAQLSPHPENPRVGDMSVIVDSIRSHGFYGALVVQRSTNRILVGNHRARAAVELGLTEVPVQYVDVDDDTARRILLVDNRANERAGFDNDRLLSLLRDLDTLDGTGYTDDDVGALISMLDPMPFDNDDDENSDEGAEYHGEDGAIRIYVGPLQALNVPVRQGKVDAEELRRQLSALFERYPEWRCGFVPQSDEDDA